MVLLVRSRNQSCIEARNALLGCHLRETETKHDHDGDSVA